MASVNGDDYGFFWNSYGGDRDYNGDSFEHWLKKFFTTGVFNGDLQVTATSGMGISVGSGYINVNGKVRLFNADTPFTLETASASNPRIDTVVVERNETDRAITLKVVTGTPSATPSATPPVRTDGVYQLVLAQIYVDTAASSISQSDITDTRTDSALCGYVASTVTEIDFDQIMAQYRAWFDEFVSHLDGDVAIELQLEINNAMDYLSNKPKVEVIVLSASGWDNGEYSLESVYPSTDWDIQIAPYESMTEAQMKAWRYAAPVGSFTGNKIVATGDTPEISLSILVYAWKKIEEEE